MTEPGKPQPKRLKIVMHQLLASLPSLIGVIVGALATHVAEVQRIDFEREDRFRQQQIKRVGDVAHAFRGLSAPVTFALAGLETSRDAMCRYKDAAAQMEASLTAAGAVHGRIFQKGANGDVVAYKADLQKTAAAPGPGQKFAGGLLGMMAVYEHAVESVGQAQKDFGTQMTSLETSTMFDVVVYFPKRVLHEVRIDKSGYYDLMRAIVKTLGTPRAICDADPAAIEARQRKLDFESSMFLTRFAQSLEPELADDQFTQ